MAEVRIFHNPRCSKSRQALALLEEHGVEPEVVRYLDDPPDAATLRWLVEHLDGSPADLVRAKDGYASEAGVDAAAATGADAVVALLAEHPRLLERPVVVAGDRVVIGRPPERVLEVLDR